MFLHSSPHVHMSAFCFIVLLFLWLPFEDGILALALHFVFLASPVSSKSASADQFLLFKIISTYYRYITFYLTISPSVCMHAISWPPSSSTTQQTMLQWTSLYLCLYILVLFFFFYRIDSQKWNCLVKRYVYF